MAFLETFIEIRNGGAAIEMQDTLKKVIEAVRKTGKPGKVTIAVSIKPASQGDVDMVFLQDTITATIPKPNKKETMFFVNEENELSRHDQRQMNMLDGLKELPAETTTLKEIR